MATDTSQSALVFGIIYACGAVVELLIRISQGVPRHMPPVFERNICLVLLVFFLLPTILWPPISLYRVLGPLFRMCLDCSHHEADSVSSVSSADVDLTSEHKTDMEASHEVDMTVEDKSHKTEASYDVEKGIRQ